MSWVRFLHTHLWHSVPRGFRRQALFNLTSRVAPKPTVHAFAKPPFIVAGFLRTASGLGEGARLCHDALAQCGHQVYGIDLATQFRQPGPTVPFSFRDGKAIEGSGTIILHINGPFVPMALLLLGKRLIAEKRIIGYWAWELPSVPSEWRLGVPFVHEIWVPSRFTAGAINPIAGEIPVYVVPHPVASGSMTATFPRSTRDEVSTFTALVVFNMGSGFSRKNPLAAIRAFTLAFGNDPRCQLVVRVVNPNLYPEGKRILEGRISSLSNAKISDGTLSRVSVDELYASANTVISLHRSEGFGLVIAEAMLRGLPVVATNWSGNVDFMNDANALPVMYSLVPAFDPQDTYDEPSCLWAEANIDDAASKLSTLHDNPAEALMIGSRAACDASHIFGAASYVNKVRELLGIGAGDRSSCNRKT